VFKARVRAIGIWDRPTSFRSPWQNGVLSENSIRLRSRIAGCRCHELDITMDLFNTEDCTRGLLNTAKAFDRDIEDMVFNNR
jgi:hypothetical protein